MSSCKAIALAYNVEQKLVVLNTIRVGHDPDAGHKALCFMPGVTLVCAEAPDPTVASSMPRMTPGVTDTIA